MGKRCTSNLLIYSFSRNTRNNLSMYAVTRAKTWLEIWPGDSSGGFFNEADSLVLLKKVIVVQLSNRCSPFLPWN